jgi:hypothetical protein
VYILGNDAEEAAAHHGLLAMLWDTPTIRIIKDIFPMGLEGKRCLEVGVGLSTHLVEWMTEGVGSKGFVWATDINPPRMPDRPPNLRILKHDITTDEHLDGGWDLIHARLVLGHIPQRRDVLARLVALLKPGGWILVEDFSPMPEHMVMCAPSMEDSALYHRVQGVLTHHVFGGAGVDPTWGRQIHGAMRDMGLADIQTAIHSEAWEGDGDDGGCLMVAGIIEQLRPQLLATGQVTEADLNRVNQLLDDPDFVLAGHLMFSTSGRKPE